MLFARYLIVCSTAADLYYVVTWVAAYMAQRKQAATLHLSGDFAFSGPSPSLFSMLLFSLALSSVVMTVKFLPRKSIYTAMVPFQVLFILFILWQGD